MGEVVNARFPKNLIKKVDILVEKGNLRSRSEALRILVEKYFAEHPELFLPNRYIELLTGDVSLTDEEFESALSRLFKEKSVADAISEGREE